MINLISTSPIVTAKLCNDFQYVGYLATPRTGHITIPAHMHFAIDNDCFNRYDPDAIIKTLKRYQHLSTRCLFAVVPDVVSNAKRTTMLFHMWHHIYRHHGLKPAYVIQNGIEDVEIP